MKYTKVLFFIIIFFLGCSQPYKYQSELIKDYEQVIDGVKTDLRMKVLEIERVGTVPLNEFYVSRNDLDRIQKIIRDNNLEEVQFPIYEATYKIFNPILQVEQELTKIYAFDPQVTMVITGWKKK